jgi:signal transduction histidine kinase
MEDLSLHIMDIIDNSISAQSSKITVKVIENLKRDVLRIEIIDNGKGMNQDTSRIAIDPFFTSKRGKRIGLGLSLLAQAARESGGKLKIKSEQNKGTKITASFMISHPDRKPLGDIEETIYMLKKAHPEISFRFNYKRKQ